MESALLRRARCFVGGRCEGERRLGPVRLTTLAGPAQAQLGGFKMRAVRATAEVPTQRHLYVTQWQVDTAGGVATKVLVIGDDPAVVERLTARASRDERLQADAVAVDCAAMRAQRSLRRCRSLRSRRR